MDDLQALVESVLRDGQRALSLLDVHAILRASSIARNAVRTGKKILLCGNGGSAADAQHLAAELVGRFGADRRALPAIALTADTATLTSIANDYGYEQVFARQVEALGSPGDVLVAITTSGASKNVIAACAAARDRGMKVIGLTGLRGASFALSCDACVVVPSSSTPRIQECHITIGHLLCEVVDRSFLDAPEPVPAFARLVPKQLSLVELTAWREARRGKQTVAWTNGVFDVLHVGHLRALRAARAFGDVLVVGVNDDASVRANKGPTRPIYSVQERVELLAGLEVVDAILVFGEWMPSRVLSIVQPDVHVKGADYVDKPMPERAIVEAYGGRVELTPPVSDRSTTDTLARLGKSHA